MASQTNPKGWVVFLSETLNARLKSMLALTQARSVDQEELMSGVLDFE
jgi:hypothetical protein